MKAGYFVNYETGKFSISSTTTHYAYARERTSVSLKSEDFVEVEDEAWVVNKKNLIRILRAFLDSRGSTLKIFY